MNDNPFGKFLMTQIAAQTMHTVITDMVENAQLLGGLASMVMEDEIEHLNVILLIEASEQCLEAVETTMKSCVPDDEQCAAEMEASPLWNDLAQARGVLNRMRLQVMESMQDETQEETTQ